ncbi:MAG: hypothetical protein LBN20_05610 [Endomicrobium sp.]|nr:hypothetical protein [Endomicrobium sp.]
MKEEINVAQGWPSPNSIFIKDDVIMIVFDSQLLDTIKKLTNDNGNNKETIRDYKKLRRLLR